MGMLRRRRRYGEGGDVSGGDGLCMRLSRGWRSGGDIAIFDLRMLGHWYGVLLVSWASWGLRGGGGAGGAARGGGGLQGGGRREGGGGGG